MSQESDVRRAQKEVLGIDLAHASPFVVVDWTGVGGETLESLDVGLADDPGRPGPFEPDQSIGIRGGAADLVGNIMVASFLEESAEVREFACRQRDEVCPILGLPAQVDAAKHRLRRIMLVAGEIEETGILSGHEITSLRVDLGWWS
ncbi:hypothetical protein [Microvirga massiliensis]|uniref:hypothetical protein n=1 Tax=Microvirga massiliensis TaxID=1033741 RepID=UPI00062BB6E2|nr:hypothetical protein [Microvirga massiliensis]